MRWIVSSADTVVHSRQTTPHDARSLDAETEKAFFLFPFSTTILAAHASSLKGQCATVFIGTCRQIASMFWRWRSSTVFGCVLAHLMVYPSLQTTLTAFGPPIARSTAHANSEEVIRLLCLLTMAAPSTQFHCPGLQTMSTDESARVGIIWPNEVSPQ